MQGPTRVATTTTNALGQYSFGYLESGVYDVVAVAPSGGVSLDAVAGTGANSQERVSANDVRIGLLNSQSSSGNHFVVAAPVAAFALWPVHPNPAQGTVRFGFALPHESNVRLAVLDVQGRERLVLAEGPYPAGRHALEWTGRARENLHSGLYFVQLDVAGRTLVQRFALVR
jgi:hypothetical protein